ncbi:DUF3806 domain-containing protein [Agromyces marinus]|uniref:DUF3806 domain-containing protein n=1 Tax=Agromyces marinus TaxID=1389020 RepID=A0ABM8GZT2_9MICO|nr:DUF3806 domain-containing protein [Agromyces marinus]UIP57810.1 hypothetical protein DSM26151_06760 [Agromyces marinus]BDZ54007.1 hypothetical protein GCM10025870_10800 [Agromyces marinus]
MPLFSRRTAPTDAPPMPRLVEIGQPERDWIDAHIALVAGAGADPDDLDQVRALYERWSSGWRRINPPERDDPAIMVSALGTAFGDHVARRTALSWRLAEHAHGVELALYQPRGQVLVHPIGLVDERWRAEETSGVFLVETAERLTRARRLTHGDGGATRRR